MFPFDDVIMLLGVSTLMLPRETWLSIISGLRYDKHDQWYRDAIEVTNGKSKSKRTSGLIIDI